MNSSMFVIVVATFGWTAVTALYGR